MGLNTLTIERNGCPALADLPHDARRHKRMGRIGVLTEMLLSEIVGTAQDEPNDGVKARLIQAGVEIGQSTRAILD